MNKSYFQKKSYYLNGKVWLLRGIIAVLFFILLISISLSIKYISRDFKNSDTIQTLKIAVSDLTSAMKLKNEMNMQVSKKLRKLEYFQRILKETKRDRYDIYNQIYDTARVYKLSPDAMLRLVEIESNFNHTARSKIAFGLTQINYSAWKHQVDFGRILEPEYNIEQGFKIFRHYLDMAEGNYKQALFWYNNGTSGYYKFWGYVFDRFLGTF